MKSRRIHIEKNMFLINISFNFYKERIAEFSIQSNEDDIQVKSIVKHTVKIVGERWESFCQSYTGFKLEVAKFTILIWTSFRGRKQST